MKKTPNYKRIKKQIEEIVQEMPKFLFSFLETKNTKKV